MARIRTIKPDFFKNEDLAGLSAMTRLLFIGLWTQADREGRLQDRPKRLKAEIFPYDNVNIDTELSRLQSAGFIERYEVGDLKVIQVNNFTRHQRITGSEATTMSELPAPLTAAHQGEEAGGNTEENFGNTLEAPRTTGKEGKGRERKGDKHARDLLDQFDEGPDNHRPSIQSELAPSPIPPPPSNTGPPLENVIFFFRGAGGTEEMAEAFWNKYEAQGWMEGYSKIVRWQAKANGYIASWHRNEEKSRQNGQRKQTTSGSIETVNAAFDNLQRGLDATMREGWTD